MADMSELVFRIGERDDKGFQRVVGGEVLVPYQRDVFGDTYTPEQVRRFAYAFMCAGINVGFQGGNAGTGVGLDVEHDEVDHTGKYYVVESYIAKDGDPEFTPGAWVLHCWIQDEALWQDILSGKIAGFSYQAWTLNQPMLIIGDFDTHAVGYTEPDVEDGHQHLYFCVLDEDGRVLMGGTDEVDYHSHSITKHSVTELANLHKHRFNLTKAQ